MEDYKKNNYYRRVNFWLHITHGCFTIKRSILKKKWIIDTYVFEERISLNYDFLKDYPFEWFFPNSFFEFEAFNKIIKARFGVNVADMKYDDLMIALKWYKAQAISGWKLMNRVFIKFYGELDDPRHHEVGRKPLDYDEQLAYGNVIRDVDYGVGLAAGNINDWESCFCEHYGNKYLILRAMENHKYMFSGEYKRNPVTEKKCIDMSQGRQIIGMAFKVIDKGTMDEAGRLKLQKYMRKAES